MHDALGRFERAALQEAMAALRRHGLLRAYFDHEATHTNGGSEEGELFVPAWVQERIQGEAFSP